MLKLNLFQKKSSQYNVLRFSTEDKSWETLGEIDLQFSNKTEIIYTTTISQEIIDHLNFLMRTIYMF